MRNTIQTPRAPMQRTWLEETKWTSRCRDPSARQTKTLSRSQIRLVVITRTKAREQAPSSQSSDQESPATFPCKSQEFPDKYQATQTYLAPNLSPSREAPDPSCQRSRPSHNSLFQRPNSLLAASSNPMQISKIDPKFWEINRNYYWSKKWFECYFYNNSSKYYL